MKKLILINFLLFLFPNKPLKANIDNAIKLNQIATQYVKLGLAIGQYDADFITSYYGPDSLKPAKPKSKVFPKEDFLEQVEKLQSAIRNVETTANDTELNRCRWLSAQLTAFGRRIKIISGDYVSFDEESKELFGVTVPVYDETYFKALNARIDSLLPGKGAVGYRIQKLVTKFIIPKNKLDIVFKAALEESRKRTMKHYNLPQPEYLNLEYVSNKPWSGFNWYKGGYKSLVQINTDLPTVIIEAIDIGSHESYPGHHVYGVLLEKNLYREKGFIEMSMFALFTPQSLIAEGTADYGIELAFPGDEKIAFTKNVLLPAAGLDTTGITTLFKVSEILAKTSYANNEAARGLINGTMTRKQAVKYLGGNAFAEKQISFIQQFRSYIINYNYGKDIVKNYIEKQPGAMQSSAKRWDLYEKLLTNEVLIADLN